LEGFTIAECLSIRFLKEEITFDMDKRTSSPVRECQAEVKNLTRM